MFNEDIFEMARKNSFFRREVMTGPHSQVVLMSLPPGVDIGNEVHKVDQVLVFVQGTGEAVLDNKEKSEIGPGHLVFVKAGTWHNFTNTGEEDLKLFTVYSPPQHEPGTVHETKADAEAEETD